MRHLKSVLISMVLLVLCVPTAAVLAATNESTTGSNGMKVSPVRTDLTMNPGDTKTVSVRLENVTNSDGQYQVLLNDFEARGETGEPSLLLDNQKNPRHGLKGYMTAQKTVSVAAGQSADVKVAITLPKDVAGGGYYGAVRFVPSSGGNGKNVTLSASIASLILVRVAGNVQENMQVAGIGVQNGGSTRSFFVSDKNLSVDIRFRNVGNVQEQPFGKVQLKKGGKVIGQYEVNNTDPRGNVLPDSIRKFSVPLKDVKGFGKYTVQGNFGYGYNGQLVSASTTFFVIPLALLIAALVLIVAIIVAVFFLPRAIRRHDQAVLRRAGRR